MGSVDRNRGVETVHARKTYPDSNIYRQNIIL